MTMPLNGGSRYERFYSVRSPIMRKKIYEDVRESPVEWCAFEGTFPCEVEATNSRTHFKEYPEVFENSWLIPVELMYLVTHSVNVRVNTRAKGNLMKAVREDSIIFRFDWKTYNRKRVPEVIGRPGVFRDRNHRIDKTGTRQYTRAVWSTFAEIHSRYAPRFIDALFGVTGISG